MTTTSKPRGLDKSEFVIIQDTREQLPYTFKGIRLHGKPIEIPVLVGTLHTGDYSVLWMEDEICVERKSVSDFYGTITRGRERFERELERMATMKRAAVVVEGRFSDLATDPLFFGSRVNPESVTGSVASFWTRYGVPCFFLDSRPAAEAFTFKLLHKYFKAAHTDGHTDAHTSDKRKAEPLAASLH